MTAKTCVPCKGGIAPLTGKEAKNLCEHVAGWWMTHGGARIKRRFDFPDFKTVLAFVNRVGAIAEAEQHHPDITFGWGYCSVELHTHKIKGLHQNDFIVAAKINEVMV